ncbi:MAG: ribose-phosphate pyrophosphokinase [Bacteroidales bacterium]|nr:ribose-phosphate pyrophosphokinase [Bacteroidales bacterium]
MQANFKIHDYPDQYKIFKFASGELQLTLEETDCFYENRGITIEGSCLSSDNIFELLLLVNAIRNLSDCDLILIMPYCAFSRQDRIQENEAFSLKVFAQLINSCNFHTVHTRDNHSDVSTALINNIINTPKQLTQNINLKQYDYLVAPDAGAIKQVQALSIKHQIPMLRADKTRNLKDGSITGTVVYTDTLAGKKVLIVDDLCQGGKTFEELSKSLKAKHCDTVNLFVTHGFFSNGLQLLKEAGIETFYTTNSVCKIKDKDLHYV